MNLKKSAAQFVVFLLFLVILATGFSRAQILTGAITGTVTDEQGLPLPGVTVELSSPVLMGGVHSQLTGENGVYRFPNLPPGTYKIVFKIAGFQTIERSAIHVTIKEIMTVDIGMKPARLEETVTVIGESPILDVTSSGTSTTINKNFIDKMPLGRNSYIDLATLTPGVSTTGDSGYAGLKWMSGFGSNAESNGFQIDGLDSTSSAFGYAMLTPNQDTFTEVEISGIGQPAEYGFFSGVVVNVVTKSGGNAFSGTLSYYGQYQALTDDNNPDPAQYFSYTRHKFYDTALSFGGPLLKDRLWFFASANITKQDETDWTVDPKYHSVVTNNNYMFKLSYQMTQKHKLVGVFSYAYYDAPGAPNQWRTPSATFGWHRTIPPWNVIYTWTINNNAYFELKTSGYSFSETGLGGDGKAGLSVPHRFDLLTGVTSGGASWPVWTDYTRLQVNASLSYFADNFLGGSHEFKMGVQYNKGKDVFALGYSGDKYYLDYGNEKYLLYTWPAFHYGGQNVDMGVFVDDSWRLGKRLTLSWGLRFDSQTGSIPAMPIMHNWQDTSEIFPGIKNLLVWRNFSPRIGLTYALTSDNKTAFKANYGRFNDKMFGGSYDATGPLNPDWAAYYWDGSDWILYNFVSGSEGWVAPRGLKAPVCDSFSMSLQRELFTDFSIEVLGTYKAWRNEMAIENTAGRYELVPMVSPDNGQTYMVYNQINVGENAYEIKNHPDHRHDYKGISLILNKRYSRNWLLNTSLTWSRSYGKNAISSTTREHQMNIVNMSSYNQGKDPNDWINAKGLMNMDRTWVFKLQFGFNFPWDILLSMNYLAMSGRPYVEQVRVYPDQGMRMIFAEPRSNKLRFDSEQMLNVRVAKTFPLYRNVRFSVMGDVFNLLNNDVVLAFRSYRIWIETFGLPSDMPLPRRLQIGLRLEF